MNTLPAVPLQHQQQECIWDIGNRGSGDPPACEMVRGGNPASYDPTKEEKGAEKRSHTKSTQKVDETPAKEDLPACAAQYLVRPHKSCYFLPSKAAGLTVLYLADTGCNPNLISKRIFDRLPQHIQDQLMSCDTHGQMADSTKLLFYGVVQIPIKVREVKLEEIFVIGQISEDAILDMSFVEWSLCAPTSKDG